MHSLPGSACDSFHLSPFRLIFVLEKTLPGTACRTFRLLPSGSSSYRKGRPASSAPCRPRNAFGPGPPEAAIPGASGARRMAGHGSLPAAGRQLARRMRAASSPIFRKAFSIFSRFVTWKKYSAAPGCSAVPAQLLSVTFWSELDEAPSAVSDTV